MATLTLFTVKRNDVALNFRADGSVTDSTDTPTGLWSASAPDRKNRLAYTPQGAAPEELDVTYGINDNNQLTVGIAADSTYKAVTSTPVRGYFTIEDRQDLVYYALSSEDPSDVGEGFRVFGDMTLDPGKNILTIDVPEMGKLKLTGHVTDGETALSISQADNGLDLIEFSAVTHNVFEGAAVDIGATVSIPGVWDLHEGQIKFVASYDSTGTTPKLEIVIAANLKGVAAGFQLYSQGKSSRLLLTLAGRIKGTNNDGDWQLEIGYAGNVLTAKGSISDTYVAPGGSLQLKGSFTVTKGGGALTFDVNLNATWLLSNGQLSVSIQGSNNKYNLSLAGNLVIAKDWTVAFQLNKGSGGSNSFSISIGNGKPGTALNSQLQLFFNGTHVTLKANLEVSLTYVNGMLVPEKP